MTTPTQRYTLPAIGLHWIIALLILIAWPLGAYMHELQLSPTKLKLYSYHKWIGITVLLLFVPRILWRITHRPPAALPMPNWQHKIAEGTHHLLYLLMLLVPLSGWLMSSAKGFQVVYFGVLPLPDLIAKNEELGDLLKEGPRVPQLWPAGAGRSARGRGTQAPAHRPRRHPAPHAALRQITKPNPRRDPP